MKTLLVAQAPSVASDPKEPLSGNSGRRLASVAGVDLPTFLDRFERVNLIEDYAGRRCRGDVIPDAVARERAAVLRPRLAQRRVVLVGIAVARAFRFDAPPLCWRDFEDGTVACCPHPSGLNRWWNSAPNVDAARVFWRGLAQA